MISVVVLELLNLIKILVFNFVCEKGLMCMRKKMMLNQILKTLKVMVFPKILVGPDY